MLKKHQQEEQQQNQRYNMRRKRGIETRFDQLKDKPVYFENDFLGIYRP